MMNEKMWSEIIVTLPFLIVFFNGLYWFYRFVKLYIEHKYLKKRYETIVHKWDYVVCRISRGESVDVSKEVIHIMPD